MKAFDLVLNCATVCKCCVHCTANENLDIIETRGCFMLADEVNVTN